MMGETTRPPLDRRRAQERYGPWAVIAGGSEGSGGAYARELAGLGLNLVLVARRSEILEALATELRAEYGVEVRAMVQDLMEPDAAQNMLDATAALDVGLYISNAGTDGAGTRFLSQPIERWRRTINMNVATVTAALHGFGNRLLERGRGGMLVMGSISGLGGRPFLAMYSASKSFEIALVESLWGELARTEVDILGVIAPAMDTPFFRRAMGEQGAALSRFVFAPEDVAREALANLGHQPLIMFPSPRHASPEQILEARRADLLRTLDEAAGFSRKGAGR